MAIKRIIFDVDDTLIPWKEEYKESLEETIKEYKLPYSSTEIDNLTISYEETYPRYSIKDFKNYCNQTLNISLTDEFIKTWLNKLGNKSEANPKINEILEYLSKKYELVILTNWFKECQEKRLENARMCHFFQEIYGGESWLKPAKESFILAIGNHKPEECLMIGDNYKVDIEGALNAGLKAIHLSDKEPINGVTTIKSLNELKNIL